jgi:hypothetical protein
MKIKFALSVLCVCDPCHRSDSSRLVESGDRRRDGERYPRNSSGIRKVPPTTRSWSSGTSNVRTKLGIRQNFTKGSLSCA